jgi:predicted alpha/beta hydrolase family esterase
MPSTILFVPGLRDHVADHWQTLLAAELPGSHTVPPLTEDRLSCTARVAALQAALSKIDGPVILAAHSAGVLIVAHWARRHSRPIKAALLATPADIETPLPAGYPTLEELTAGGWLPMPRVQLPFPALVIASDTDSLAKADRVTDLARDWGAECENLGDIGHLNPAGGYGPWPMARTLLERLDGGPLS